MDWKRMSFFVPPPSKLVFPAPTSSPVLFRFLLLFPFPPFHKKVGCPSRPLRLVESSLGPGFSFIVAFFYPLRASQNVDPTYGISLL